MSSTPPLPPADLTAILRGQGYPEGEVIDHLLPLVYAELVALARRHLSDRRAGHTLDTTALVHEAYLHLSERGEGVWDDRSHFFGVAAVTMRRIVIDYARRRRADKRGGDEVVVTFTEAHAPKEAKAEELIALDEALDRLSQRFERPARVVEMAFFGGLTQPEIAEVLQVSVPTVKRDWTFARAWLGSSLADG